MRLSTRFALVALLVGASAATPGARCDDGAYRPGGGDARLDAAASAIQLGVPRRVIVSLDDVVVEIPVLIRPVGVGGTIERVEFADLAVNGIPFEVEPYGASFDLPEKDAVELAAPLRLKVRFANVAPGVLEESLYPSDTLRLTGRVTVTGTFRKWILSFKRAIEIPVDVSRPNPIAQYHPGRYLVDKLGGWLP